MKFDIPDIVKEKLQDSQNIIICYKKDLIKLGNK